MKNLNRKSRLVAICLTTVLIMVCATVISAESKRSFSGSFVITNVVNTPPLVKFNLRVRVQNVTATDVTSATLKLESSRPGAADDDPDFAGSFQNVKIPAHRMVTLSGDFTVPEAEYAQWLRGGGPRLVVTYVDDAQEEVQSTAELREIR